MSSQTLQRFGLSRENLLFVLFEKNKCDFLKFYIKFNIIMYKKLLITQAQLQPRYCTSGRIVGQSGHEQNILSYGAAAG